MVGEALWEEEPGRRLRPVGLARLPALRPALVVVVGVVLVVGVGARELVVDDLTHRAALPSPLGSLVVQPSLLALTPLLQLLNVERHLAVNVDQQRLLHLPAVGGSSEALEAACHGVIPATLDEDDGVVPPLPPLHQQVEGVADVHGGGGGEDHHRAGHVVELLARADELHQPALDEGHGVEALLSKVLRTLSDMNSSACSAMATVHSPYSERKTRE